jgi:hypothetical protein
MVIVAIESHQGAIDMQVTTIGLDIAKNVFQVHGIDAAEKLRAKRKCVACARNDVDDPNRTSRLLEGRSFCR